VRDWANDGFVEAEKAGNEPWKGPPAQLRRKSGRAVSRQLGAEFQSFPHSPTLLTRVALNRRAPEEQLDQSYIGRPLFE